MSADRRTRRKHDRVKASKSLLTLLVPVALFALLYFYALGDESVGRHIHRIVDPLVQPLLRFMDSLFNF